MDQTNPIIDQICQPFRWSNHIEGPNFGIYVQSLDTEQTYLLASGPLESINPWRIRAIAMFTYWYLLTQGVQLPPVPITVESIEEMRAEEFKIEAVQSAIAAKKLVGPDAFAVDPSEIKNYLGTPRIQHAPPATSPIGYTEDGELQIMPGASPRRVLDNRLSW